jgi:hypothetical protein
VNKLNIITELITEAKTSPHHESFKTIQSSKKTRLGAGHRNTETLEFFIEVNIKTCTNDPVDPQELVQLGETLDRLVRLGFKLSCEDNGFYAVKQVQQEQLTHELETAKNIVYHNTP